MRDRLAETFRDQLAGDRQRIGRAVADRLQRDSRGRCAQRGDCDLDGLARDYDLGFSAQKPRATERHTGAKHPELPKSFAT